MKKLKICGRALALTLFAGAAFCAGPPNTVVVTSSTSIMPANGKAYAELVAEVRDSSGVLVENGTVVTWSVDSLGIVDPVSSTTSGGKVSTRLKAPINTGESTITATAGSVNGNAVVQFSGPAALGVEMDPMIKSIRADGVSKQVIIATFADNNGAPVADGTPVSFSATNGVSITPVGITQNGAATAMLTAGTNVGPVDVTATCGAGTITRSYTMVGAPAKLDIASTKTSIKADGISQCEVCAFLKDVDDNPVNDGLTVSFTTDKGTISSSAMTVNGVATVLLTSCATPGPATITATYGSVVGEGKISMFGEPAVVRIDSDALAISANGTSKTKLVITALDASGGLITDGVSVTLSATGGTLNTTSVSIVDGMAEAMLTSSTVAGSYKVSCSSGAAHGEADVYFVGAPASLSLRSSLDSNVADGATTCEIQGYVTDANDQPVADGTPVTLTTDSGHLESRAVTSGGHFTSMLKSASSSSLATVQATCGQATGQTAVDFGAGASQGSVSVCPAVIPADGISTGLVKFSLLDSNGRPVPDGTVVTFTTSMGIVTNSSTTSNGVAVGVLTASNQTGSGTVTVTSNGVTRTASFNCQ